jgi:AraC-like DNA-binding protein
VEQDPTLKIADGFPSQRMIVLPRPVVADALRKPITSDLLVTDAGMFPSAASHYIERRQGMSQAIVIYCVHGEGWTEIGGVHHVVRQDDVLVVPPGTPHLYGASTQRPWTIYWCHAAGRNVQHMLELLQVQAKEPVLRTADTRQLVPLFDQVVASLETGYTQTSLILASLTFGHFLGLLLANRRSGDSRLADLDERIDETIDFMQQSIGGVMNISELAAIAKLSPSHYAVVFKRKTGYSVLDFFIRLKMQEACRLLDMTNLPIKSIADRLGYEDALYFSRAFRKVMHIPPREYRAHRKG